MPEKPHAVVEIVDKAAGGTEGALKAGRVISGSEAFRKYDWIKNIRPANTVGNFRGMVISSRWAVMYNFAETSLKVVEKVAVFAALAANIYKAKNEFQKIIASSEDWGTKSSRLSTQVSSVSIRTLGGVIPAGTHIIAMSLGGYLGMADIAQVLPAHPPGTRKSNPSTLP